jgi:NADH dehydrogenase
VPGGDPPRRYGPQPPRAGAPFERAHRVATERVVAACLQLGIDRLVTVSALGARRDAPSAFHRSKWQAEEVVRDSALAWTIVRPALMFGSRRRPRGRHRASVAKRAAGPRPGDGAPGSSRSRPRMADILVACLERPATIHQFIDLGGRNRSPSTT